MCRTGTAPLREGLMKIDNSPARGMRDLLPADVAVRDHVLESISAVYRRFGYQRIETPALEHIDRLSSGEGGDNEKLIFEVLRRGLPPEVAAGTPLRELVDLGLRYDLTVPLTRFYGNNHASLPMPFRSLQVGPVWRAGRPQRGRDPQVFQCGIAIIGRPAGLAGGEVISDLAATAAALERLSAERPLSWRFDPTLVRGMGYYTGQVFEVIHDDMSGSVAGGGRYDKLIGRSLGQDVPACGFSIGFERIVDLLSAERSRDAIAVLVEADVPAPDVVAVAREMREQAGPGRVVETVRRSGKFGAQLKRLEAAGFTGFVLVRSEDGTIVRGEPRALGGEPGA